MKNNFWQSKKVLVTGHSGFKGGWLSLWLQSLGCRVVGYSLAAPTSPSLFLEANVAEGMQSVTGDIRDLDHLKKVFAREKPEIVFHLAAQSLVKPSFDDPVGTYSTNIMGTVNVLEAIRATDSVKALVNITSDKCYENREWYWGYRENDPMGGFDPYSSSKGCAELITSAFRQSFFSGPGANVGIATARAGNVIGGGDWAQYRLIPDIIKTLMQHQPLIIRHPGSVRPWQHVLESLHGYLLLAEALWHDPEPYSEGWNFGPEEMDTQSVQGIMEQLIALWGQSVSWKLDSDEKTHEALSLKLDCSKAKTSLGWRPKTRLKTGLKWVVEWYQAFQQGKKMRAETLEQINRFEKMESE